MDLKRMKLMLMTLFPEKVKKLMRKKSWKI